MADHYITDAQRATALADGDSTDFGVPADDDGAPLWTERDLLEGPCTSAIAEERIAALTELLWRETRKEPDDG